jgi:hypothetical protein
MLFENENRSRCGAIFRRDASRIELVRHRSAFERVRAKLRSFAQIVLKSVRQRHSPKNFFRALRTPPDALTGATLITRALCAHMMRGKLCTSAQLSKFAQRCCGAFFKKWPQTA